MSIADAGGPKAPGQEQPVSFLFVLLMGFVCCVVFSWPPITTTWLTGAYNDTDDVMRMVQVRDWMAGQGWYDLRALRLDPPGGVLMHWSRVVDLPLAGLIRLFGLVADQETAERLARIVFPLSMQALLLLGAGLSGRLLAGPMGGMLAIFLVISSGMSLGQFVPGRIDHHAPQIVLLSFMTWACLCGLDPRRAPMAGLAGVFAALSLAIAIENLSFIMALIVVYPIAWAGQGAPLRAALVWLALGFVSSLTLFYALFQSPALWGAPVCDALSAPHMRAAFAGGVAMLLLAAFDRWRKPALRQRILATAAAGLLAAPPLVLDRQCYLDPFNGLDPLVRDLWLSHVQEALSIPQLLAAHPESFWSWVMPWALGAAAIALAAGVERNLVRTRHLALLALTLVGCATAVYMNRSITSVSPLAAMGGVWAAMRLRQWRGKDDGLAAILMLAALAPFTVFAWVLLFPLEEPSSEKEQGKKADSCLLEASLTPLRALPEGLVLAQIDLGPFVLLHTRHSVIAGPYHRNNHGNRLMFDILMAAPEAARETLRAAGVRYIVLCDAPKEGEFINQRAPQGLSAAIAHETPLDWLRPLKLETPLRVFEVAAAP